jgi:DNA-binding PucR family transcriptional regulator
VVAAARDGVACAIVGDPAAPGRHARLMAAVGDRRGVLGPVVGVGRAGHSLRRALATLRLADLDAGMTDAGEHLGALMLGADPGLAAELAHHRLAPLERVSPGAATRLAATLRAWLDRPGQVQAVAEALGVHPQTVRYRVRQLRELFGDKLDDPDARFELALALRAREVAR